MKATLLKVDKKPSKYGGEFYYLFFKGEDGKSYRSCIMSQYGNRPCGNFTNWQNIVRLAPDKLPVIISGLVIRKQSRGNEFDADCEPKIIQVQNA